MEFTDSTTAKASPAGLNHSPPCGRLYTDTIRNIITALGNPGVVFCQTEDLHRHLDEWAEFGRRIYVFCGNSDYGICEQNRDHPNADLLRTALYGIDWERVLSERSQYLQVPIGPTCDLRYCHPQDKYIVKMERTSLATFEDIPPNVHLFSANLNVRHPRMNWLPSGLNPDEPGRTILGKLLEGPSKAKRGLLYVNFQPHTGERIQLRQHWRKFPWVTYRENVPVDQYLNELAEHQFVLSPAGNGLDCYRNYEALYLGTTPVLADSVFSRYFIDHHLPVLILDNLFEITRETLLANIPKCKTITNKVLSTGGWEGLIGRLG